MHQEDGSHASEEEPDASEEDGQTDDGQLIPPIYEQEPATEPNQPDTDAGQTGTSGQAGSQATPSQPTNPSQQEQPPQTVEPLSLIHNWMGRTI